MVVRGDGLANEYESAMQAVKKYDTRDPFELLNAIGANVRYLSRKEI